MTEASTEETGPRAGGAGEEQVDKGRGPGWHEDPRILVVSPVRDISSQGRLPLSPHTSRAPALSASWMAALQLQLLAQL